MQCEDVASTEDDARRAHRVTYALWTDAAAADAEPSAVLRALRWTLHRLLAGVAVVPRIAEASPH